MHLHKARNPDKWEPLSQPVGAVEIDWTDSLARGLMGVWLFNRGPATRNLVNGIPTSLTVGTAIKGDTTAHGVSARCTASNDSISLGIADTVSAASSSFGMIRSRRVTGASQSTFSDPGINTHLPWSDDVVYWDYPTSSDRVSAALPAAFQTAPLTERWLLHGGAAGRGVWVNGVAVIDVGTPTTTAAPSNSGAFVLNLGAAGGQDQDFHYFVTWSRQLSNLEIVRWSFEPYCFLRPGG